MSDKMRPISFEKLLNWVMQERRENGTIFGIHEGKFYRNKSNTSIEMFGEKLSTPIGPAAGPNSQLAQNIIASYLTGSRFIELKTVQILDGEDLPVSKPCILAEDECYNVEWSTELRVPEAFDEYLKAWFLLHVLMKELGISNERDFMFNMSVGYDLAGIKSPKIDAYIEGMRDASNTEVWGECVKALKNNMHLFSKFTHEDLDKISPVVCKSITLSTLHGCPPEEIERIANYLLKEKNLFTFIKMNPTLLGEKFVRDTFDQMGYDYVTLNGHHFIHDLQYPDAIEMLKRLKQVAKELKLEIGVKLTNTLPTKILNNELPGEEMYMSGRSLFPLSITLASRLAKDFNGDLQISYSGGADFFNIDKILETGIQPITFATTILKPGGYERITQMAKKLEESLKGSFSGIKIDMLNNLAKEALRDKYHVKELRPVGSRKLSKELPLFDCAIAPCTVGCPINQQIPQYISLVGERKYDDAFKVIVNDNTSPAITGSICNHECQFKCTRLDYEESVLIRNMKKLAVENAQDKYVTSIEPVKLRTSKKAVVIGAGPAGLAAAMFLRRNGMEVTVRDKRDRAYGTVEYVIPEFRISSEMIKRDFELVKAQGVNFEFGVDSKFNLEELKKNYDYVVVAIGAQKPGKLELEEGSEKAINAISFLENYKKSNGKVNLGKHVVIIGGGNVAMDAARAAKRVEGVASVSIVYRRTKKYMPADHEEIVLAEQEGILFRELLAPKAIVEGKLTCDEMKLGDRDSSGRRSPVATGNTIKLDADTVIVAIGEHIEGELLTSNGIELDSKGFPKVNTNCETSIQNVYIAGDVRKGPATIVKGIADGKAAAKDILCKEGLETDFVKFNNKVDEGILYTRKGMLKEPSYIEKEAGRCLSCDTICELCVDVCPNRANVMVLVKEGFKSTHQIVHIDGMCNECGNCGVFCPNKGNPYKDKFTIFWSIEDFEDSTNRGFLLVDKEKGLCKVRKEDGSVVDVKLSEEENISREMAAVIKSCIENYSYFI